MLILLVEDNRLLANNIIQYLALKAIEEDYAETIAQAEARLVSQHFDVIVLDLNLPDGDGINTCRY